MVLFWSLVGLMLVAALALLLPPLLSTRAGRGGSVTDSQAALAAHRARAAALEEQLADGTLERAAFEQAMEELERDVLRDAPSGASGSGGARRARAAALVVAVALPAFSLMIYFQTGNSDALGILDDAERMHAAQLDGTTDPAVIERMADKLRARLDSRGDDLDGWLLLARTRMRLAHYATAAAALERAVVLSGNDPRILIDSVEAMAMANDMRFPPIAQTRIERALTARDGDPKGLMLGALAALQRGDRAVGLSRLRRLRETHADGSQQAAFLDRLIAEVGGAADSASADGASDDATAEGQAASPRIVVEVALAGALAPSVTPDQRVFVFARRASGAPMPLAATTLTVAALPATVVLDDSMAMVAGNALSSAERIVVGARVSLSGSATPASGDLEGVSEPLAVEPESRVRVVIDTRRP